MYKYFVMIYDHIIYDLYLGFLIILCELWSSVVMIYNKMLLWFIIFYLYKERITYANK